MGEGMCGTDGPGGSSWVVLVPQSRPRAWTSESWVWTPLASRLWLRLWSG